VFEGYNYIELSEYEQIMKLLTLLIWCGFNTHIMSWRPSFVRELPLLAAVCSHEEGISREEGRE
jgi:hypothetical protein